MTEHEFDKQINDSFGGVGKHRTLLSGTWAQYITNACAFLKTNWTVAASWQDRDSLIVTLSSPQADGTFISWMISASITRLSQRRAIECIASKLWLQAHEPLRYGKEGVEYVPANAICHDLYYELWQNGREGEYEALGGLYT